jgi:hypothetical protein
MFDFYKSIETNQKLAREVAAEVATAAIEFGKVVTDVNTRLAETFKAQATEAYKNVEAFKVPGMDAFTKGIKKASKADQA